jgi:carbohydrate diacid regulator
MLRANCSVAGAANSTGVHRHTIRNHLDRARDLTGLDPRVLEDALQLHLALLIERHDSEPG